MHNNNIVEKIYLIIVMFIRVQIGISIDNKFNSAALLRHRPGIYISREVTSQLVNLYSLTRYAKICIHIMIHI